MRQVQFDTLVDRDGVAHLVPRSFDEGCAVAVCGAHLVRPAVVPGEGSGQCGACRELEDDITAGRSVRRWRQRGQAFAVQKVPDVVTVQVGSLSVHVWRHPDGALIEAVEAEPDRHASYVSLCRDPERPGGKAVMLAVSHGVSCEDRPLWPVAQAEFAHAE